MHMMKSVKTIDCSQRYGKFKFSLQKSSIYSAVDPQVFLSDHGEIGNRIRKPVIECFRLMQHTFLLHLNWIPAERLQAAVVRVLLDCPK